MQSTAAIHEGRADCLYHRRAEVEKLVGDGVREGVCFGVSAV
jgi:hypothetical protein